MRATTRTFRRWVLLGLALSLGACGSDSALGEGRLQGEAWRLLLFQRADGTQVVLPSATFTAGFGDDGRLSVQADCNSCGGGYEADATGLRVTPLACTRVFCSSAPVDTEYVVALQSAREYEVGEHLLTLRGGGLLVFER